MSSRIAIKFFAEARADWGDATRQAWQRWILDTPQIEIDLQSGASKSLLAIDVADYLHAKLGTRLALIFFGAHLAIDDADNKLGLLFCDHGRVEDATESIDDIGRRIEEATATLDQLARRLEDDLPLWTFDRQHPDVTLIDSRGPARRIDPSQSHERQARTAS
jgi:hypothetical protein